MTSVISEKNKHAPSSLPSDSMKFKTIGDTIEGIYIGRRFVEDIPTYDGKGLESKYVYDIEVPVGGTVIIEGNTINIAEETVYAVWGKPGEKSFIDKELKNFPSGEQVGFVFESEVPPRKAGMHPKKMIAIHYDEEKVKKAKAELDNIEESFNEAVPEVTTPATSTPATESVPNTNALGSDIERQIINIVKTKYGVATDESAKMKAMEVTTLAFMPSNYPALLEKLQQL